MEGTIFSHSRAGLRGSDLPDLDVPEVSVSDLLREIPLRNEPVGLPEVTESQAMRHFVTLSVKNHHIEKGLYPLGSCTMKYNPKFQEDLARLPGMADLHPELPDHMVQGTLKLMYTLGRFLCEITGFDDITLQPAAGAQGELTGLLLIRKYHLENGDKDRKVILMPDSAHGTNPASCTLAGFTVRGIKSNDRGEVDVDDLRSASGSDTAGLMLTNPNTLGLFESKIEEIIEIVHKAGGMVYMDGANMNALLEIARPGDMGFDVCHLNLHKTFSTPHGGGGPGSGPVACKAILAPYLPSPVIVKEKNGYSLKNNPAGFGRLLAYHGNTGVLYRAYAYIRTLGETGLRQVSETAVLNANYLKARLKKYFDLPFDSGPCMHEFVLSGSRQAAKGIKTLDMAKRLLDYGFHAPTIYFPLIVKEALMVEPTETESLESLDAFADAMISIAREVDEKPHLVRDAPVNTPVLRLDEVKAVKELNVVEEWENINRQTKE